MAKLSSVKILIIAVVPLAGLHAERPSDDIDLTRELRPQASAIMRQLSREFRTYDGSNNNQAFPDVGAAGSFLLRLTSAAYEDGAGTPSGADRPGPREISSAVVAQPRLIPNADGLSDMFWQWGQFIDHDLDLTPSLPPFEDLNIPVPSGDPSFDPLSTGTQSIAFTRSFFDWKDGVREQININSGYLDASQVYGSDEARASELRTRDGSGRMKTSPGNLLPFNEHGFFNFPVDDDASFFLAGDVRANEQVGLTSMHTLFVREHNFWADAIRRLLPWARDEQIYQTARMIVGAEIQCITYREFLPLLLGPKALPPYAGYQPGVNAGIASEFSTAAYRVGHTLLSPQLLRLQRNGRSIPEGPLPLKFAFFNPEEFLNSDGPDTFLLGLASQRAQQVDPYVIDDVRNFLFGPPGAGGFDLASLNIQRGRDHGLPDYNRIRVELGLPRVSSFARITSDPEIQARLASIYPTVDTLDLWVAGLAEDHLPGAQVGETFHAILRDQFGRLRDGDRFWYQIFLPAPMVRMIERQTLGTIIRRNTSIGRELQDHVFIAPSVRGGDLREHGRGRSTSSKLLDRSPDAFPFRRNWSNLGE